MSVWGKVVGGAAGFALGGPLGALLGAAAGHAVDKMRVSTREAGEPSDATKNIAFTIGVIVLGAKMAKADGRVTRDEVAAFKQVFHVPADELAWIEVFCDGSPGVAKLAAEIGDLETGSGSANWWSATDWSP